MDGNREHIEYDDLIMKYLSNEADLDEKVALLKAISENELLRKYFMQQKRLYNTISQLEVQDFDAQKAYSYFEQHTQEEAKLVPFISKTTRYALQIAASVAVLVGAWFLYSNLNKKTECVQVLATNEIVQKQLSDSSIISINKHSKVTYDKSFGTERRQVMLEGEAFFEVKHNEKMPFSVKTDEIVVTDIGTAFNINASKCSNTITVTVESGIVRVDDREGKQTVTITKGEKAEFLRKEKLLRKVVNNEYNFSAWKTQTLIFKDTRLDDVMKELQTYYNTSIELKNPQLGSCVLNAKYDHYSIDSIFEMLQLTFNISVKKENGKYLIFGEGCSF